MLRIGITGGIGSGKTTVCKLFQTLGIPVYFADDKAKKLMRTSPKLIEGIKEIVGENAYFEDGSLNRAFIASIIFNDKEKLAKMNGLVHPAVFEDTSNWFMEHLDKNYVLYEAALLFESGSYKNFDKVITVHADKEIRIERVMKRDGTKREQVLARMDKQLPDAEKIEKADFVIHNEGKELLIKQVLALDKKLIELIEKKEQE